MLVLTRKLQQQIVIPGLNIRITVLSLGTSRVQLGIEAPGDIQISRPELTMRAVGGGAKRGLDEPTK